MKFNWTTLVWIALASFILFFFNGYRHSESYCFFNPSIDTRYAPGFSEKSFELIHPGMSAQEVQKQLGPPLFTSLNSKGGVDWYYTSDGKCKWGDWAWLVRIVNIKGGEVREVVRRVSYD